MNSSTAKSSTLIEEQVLTERWRQHYITVRTHSSLNYRPPAPQAIMPRESSTGLACAVERLRPDGLASQAQFGLT